MSSRSRGTLAAAAIAIASLPGALESQDSAWIIRGGTYSGRSVSIDRSLAGRKPSRFWRLTGSRGERRIVGWNPSDLPALIALRPGRITSSDSAAFWSIVREMESDLGIHLFEPASLDDDPDPRNVIVVEVKSMAGDDGVTYITWSSTGAPYDVRVYLRSPASLHDSRVVTHEMMHALGFGHTSSWQSVMNGGTRGPPRLTAEDVAYAQAAFESRLFDEKSDMWARVALAVSREDSPRAAGRTFLDCTPPGVIELREPERAVPPIEDPMRSGSYCR